MVTDLYLVWIWDGYNDSCSHLQIIFTIEKEAIEYASATYLPHEGVVYVTKNEIGVCCPSVSCRPNYVYRRQYYDPQEALFDEAKWIYLKDMSKKQFVRLVVGNYSPICINVDWDTLYQRCIDYYYD